MYRKALEELLAWKGSPRRKPLVLKGARQVGKTWLMKELASVAYNDSFYISFDKDADVAKVFDETKDPKLIIERLALIRNKTILPEKTLIILDEIQECPNALGCLNPSFGNNHSEQGIFELAHDETRQNIAKVA